jgi:hypothetical protein
MIRPNFTACPLHQILEICSVNMELEVNIGRMLCRLCSNILSPQYRIDHNIMMLINPSKKRGSSHIGERP